MSDTLADVRRMCGRRARTVAPTPARASRALAPAPIVNEEFQIVAVDDALNGNGGWQWEEEGQGHDELLGLSAERPYRN